MLTIFSKHITKKSSVHSYLPSSHFSVFMLLVSRAVFSQKKRLVITGAGWAGMSMLKAVDPTKFRSVTVVSPRNYFLFTPLLPSVAVGTTEPRSIMEPVRNMIAKKRKQYPAAHIEYVEMDAVGVDANTNELFCEYAGPRPRTDDELKKKIPYDLLVLAPGAKSNTFNTPGVEQYCHFLKEMAQARGLRNAVLDAFESASICTDEAEKRRLLSFVIIGGGPTGVEYAAELTDFLDDDLSKAYKEVAHLASVTLIQSSDAILNMFDKAIQDYAEKNFERINIKVLKNTKVLAVGPKQLALECEGGQKKELDYGVAVWTAGIAPRRITAQVIETLGEAQKGNKLISADSHLKVVGADNIYAIGDCVSITRPQLVRDAEKFLAATQKNKNQLNRDDFVEILEHIKSLHPNCVDVSNADDLFALVTDRSYNMSKDQFIKCLDRLEKSFKSAPQSAQVAQQQAEYLAKYLMNETNEPWAYTNRGMMSYVGEARAVLQSPQLGVLKGMPVFSLWRGAYASKLMTMRSRVLVVIDWMKEIVFGRDISRM
jgi:NADH:ubiquinone reductase (non-electrogenic)